MRSALAYSLVVGGDWKFVEDPQPAVDGGDGFATVSVTPLGVFLLRDHEDRNESDHIAHNL